MWQRGEFFKYGYNNSKWFYVFLFMLTLVLTNNRQHKITNFNCEICADKAGYYMYLPASFHLGFTTKNYSVGFDQKHGYGFHIDIKKDRIITKFTCGIAILLSPFYGTGAFVEKLFSLNVLSYSGYYMFFINIGAAFYLVLGLYFLRKWLNYYVDSTSSFLTILVVFFGTNLYYYTLDESLMSHLYSFTLFSSILYGFKALYETGKLRFFLLFIISLSLAVLIRPTNILFGIIALLTDVKGLKVLKTKLLLVLTLKRILTGVFIFLLILLPQVLYWKFAYDKYIVWTYKGEGFKFWSKPELLLVWFSPQSGLFTYTPVILMSLFYAIVMWIKKERNAFLVIFVFIISSYMCASWSDPFFGTCNFGKRPMVEYLPILMMPISYMFVYFKSYNKLSRYLILIFTILFVYYNQAVFAAFDTCFIGGAWEWDKFVLFLKKALIFKG